MLCTPFIPMVNDGFADHYPVMKNGYFTKGILTQHFQTKPNGESKVQMDGADMGKPVP